jgi:murein DD-endopeptidase MepM/ murein hydrolase activator NlpD
MPCLKRRLPLLLLILPFVLAAPASGDDYARKQAVDQHIAQLHEQMAAASAREDALSGEIASTTGDIRSLEQQVGDVTRRLRTLQHDLDLHRARLAKLTELLGYQTQRLRFLRSQYRLAMERLDRRVVELYKQDQPGTLDVVVSAASFSDALDQLDYMRDIGNQDVHVSASVEAARDEMRVLRAQTQETQQRVATATRVIAVRTAQHLELQNKLIARKSGLVAAHSSQVQALATVQEHKRNVFAEASALEEVSSRLAAQIQAAQAASAQAVSSSASVASSTPSASGLIWPVSGPVVSGFGMRWGRMHEGIDIAAGYGTPIVAAASGTVIAAGWEGGYGNLIVIDHGNGLATAYAHQSSFAVGYGAHVSQGQTVGYVGCTGHCYGPHLHFEVRVNGAAVDPLGYL